MLRKLFQGMISNSPTEESSEDRPEQVESVLAIVTDRSVLGNQVRTVLLKQGQSCPPEHVVSPTRAKTFLSETPIDLLIVALTQQDEGALANISNFRELTQGRLIAIGPATDPKWILRVLRSGADEYLDVTELDSELSTLSSQGKTDGRSKSQPGKLLAFLGPSGGTGTSTLAVNVASVLAQEHSRSLLLDMKLDVSDLATLLNLKPSFTLVDLCQNSNTLDRAMVERCLATHESGVSLLAAPRRIEDRDRVTPQAVRMILQWTRMLFPYVVADVDRSFREEQSQVLRSSDLVILVMRADFTTLKNSRSCLVRLRELEVPDERIRIVINRHGQPQQVPRDKVSEALGLPVQQVVPDDPKSMNWANNTGVPVVLENPSSRVAKSLHLLAVSSNGRIKD